MTTVLVEVPYFLGRRGEGLATGVPVLAETLAADLGARRVSVDVAEESWNEVGASMDVVRALARTVSDVVAAVGAAAAILVEVLVAIGLKAGHSLSHSAHVSGSFGSPAEIGRLFLTDHLLAFEITSVVLLIAAVGGVVLGAHARRLQAEADPAGIEPAREESPVEIPAAR